ncbi:MAG: hypothetical protein HY026_11150 [Deltaproteobacteria bacterium]|nr:hypothetical protein [Deltaproteobacteria bacterium]
MVDPVASKISNKIPATIAAIKNDNRAEAWYEIRYNSNSDGQHANRRYSEADMFGLYDTGAIFTDAEAKEVVRMYTEHRGEIARYEISYPPSDSGYANITTDIKPASDYLITNFASGKTIDGQILVGADTNNYLKDNPNDAILGTDKNDLIFGEKGNDALNGGAGNDVIYGGQGNDVIYGGTGNDTVFGGQGDDWLQDDAGDDHIDGAAGKIFSERLNFIKPLLKGGAFL